MEVIRNDQSNQSLFEKAECIANFSVISPGLLETPNVIINIQKIPLLGTNLILAFVFSTSIGEKCFIFGTCVQFESAFQISNFISLVSFLLYTEQFWYLNRLF